MTDVTVMIMCDLCGENEAQFVCDKCGQEICDSCWHGQNDSGFELCYPCAVEEANKRDKRERMAEGDR